MVHPRLDARLAPLSPEKVALTRLRGGCPSAHRRAARSCEQPRRSDEFLVDVAIGESAAEGRGSLRVVASLAPRARRGPLGVPVSRRLAYLLAGGHRQPRPRSASPSAQRARRAAGALVLVALLNLIYPLNTWTHAPGELPLQPVALCLWAAAIAWCFGARRAFLIGAFLVPPAAAFAWNILAHPGKWAGDGPWIAIDLFALGALGTALAADKLLAPGTPVSSVARLRTAARLGLDRGGRLHRGQLAPQNYSHTNRVPCVECRKPVCLLRGDSRRLPRPGGQGQSSRPGRWGYSLLFASLTLYYQLDLAPPVDGVLIAWAILLLVGTVPVGARDKTTVDLAARFSVTGFACGLGTAITCCTVSVIEVLNSLDVAPTTIVPAGFVELTIWFAIGSVVAGYCAGRMNLVRLGVFQAATVHVFVVLSMQDVSKAGRNANALFWAAQAAVAGSFLVRVVRAFERGALTRFEQRFLAKLSLFLANGIALGSVAVVTARTALKRLDPASYLRGFREAEQFSLSARVRHVLRDREPIPTDVQAALCFVLILTSTWFLLVYLTRLGSDLSIGSVVAGQLIILLPPVIMAFLMTSDTRMTLRLAWPEKRYLFLAVALVVALNPLVNELRPIVEPLFPISSIIKTTLARIMSQSPGLLTSIVIFALIPAVCEEFAFRGFILSGLEHEHRTRSAILLSALMFGFLHVLLSLFQQLFNATLLGVVLGLLAVRSRSILPGIVFHFLNNALAVALGSVVHAPWAAGIVPWIYRNPGRRTLS